MEQTPPMPAFPEPPPPEPQTPRRRVVTIVSVVALLAIVGGTAAILWNRSPGTSKGPGTFLAHGVSFRYPSDWQDLGPPTYQAEAGSATWAEGFGPSPGRDVVIVGSYGLSGTIVSESSDEQEQELARTIGGLIASQNGTVTTPIHATQVGGKPAWTMSFTLPETDGDLLTDTTIRVDGATEFAIVCQYHEATRSEIVAGCQQVIGSFSTG